MILMVYNKLVCKEFLLPNLHDVDYEIRLYQDIFHIKRDVELSLENSSRGWEIVSGETYYIKENQVRIQRYLLRDNGIVEIKTMDGERFQVIAVDCQLSFPITKKYDIGMMKEISVGKSIGNLIRYQFMDLISASHVTFIHHSDGWYLNDTSTNGVFCDDVRIKGRKKLKFGDHIESFGLHIIFLEDMIAVGNFYGELEIKEDILKPIEIPQQEKDRMKERKKHKEQYFHRSPRYLPVLHRESVEIEAPPSPRVIKQKPLFMTIGPAFTMAIPMMLGCAIAIFGSRISGQSSGAFMYTGLITAVSSSLIGVVWAVLNLNYSKKEQLEDENQRFNAYSNYLIMIADSIREKYCHNTEAMNQMYPSAKQCLSYGKDSSELWNRNHSHQDFLFQRLGIGEQPFQVEIGIPKEKFTLINDSLLEKPKMIREEFRTLRQVPVGISLLDKTLIGLVGGEGKQGAVQMMHTLVVGITAAHSYTDVKLVFIYREYDRKRQEDWECMRWFPHVWSEDKSTRYMAADELETGDIFFELSNVLRSRSQEANIYGNGNKKKFVKPHYIMFVSDPSILEGEILTKYIYEAKPEYGITTLLMVETLEQLPNECEDVIQNDPYFHGVYNMMDTEHGKKTFLPDIVKRNELAAFGEALANIRVNEVESNNEIPGSLNFLEMYGASNLDELEVAERWRKNRNYNSMKVLVGKKSGNQDCYLDIHEKFHGPHGLVAGTTGSGKSETLQTYILSLAVNFSPEDVSFFIIDFKGGGMANLFSDIPHLSGKISNLSGNQVHRAMISIKSENQRRQRVFSEYGVNNINLYTKLYKNHETDEPIPHLFIIIDEFAELKREEPDFMRELISVAQVGRSLGVHLILATQKPSGTVDDNIWSNSRFRLCLRVQDRQDSNDMLHKPDAAFLTQAGRCYLQVGNDEIYELFQSGYSGAAYDENENRQTSSAVLLTRTGKAELSGSRKRKVQEMPEKTQLEAVIEYLNKVALKNNYAKTRQLWQPVLKEKLYLSEISGYQESWEYDGKWSLDALIGLYDDPHNQIQKPVFVSLSEGGHHAVCGSVVSGKSTFLQTMVFSFIKKYSPAVLQIYILDYSSHMLAPFEKAPHVGGVVFDNEEEKVTKFIHMLQTIMNERKKMFQGGNYSQYVQAYGIKVPAIMMIIDNFAAFREKTRNVYDDVILRLVREGVGYGIFLVVTAAGFGMAEIPSRIGDNIRTVVSLEMADKYKYMEVMRVTRIPIIPETDVRGRGVINVDGRILEFQTALSVKAEDDFERSQKIEGHCEEMGRQWNGVTARKIPEIPEKPILEILTNSEQYKQMLITEEWMPMGYRMEDASVYGIDLSKNYCYSVTGKSRTGKTNVLKVLLSAAYGKKGNICVIEDSTSELKKLSDDFRLRYISNSKELFCYLQELLPEFSRRNKIKRKLLEDGHDEEEVFDYMKKEKPIFIFLADIGVFFRMVYKPGEGVGNMSGFVENILEKGSLHHIYFFGCLKVEEQSLLSTYRAYSLYISYKRGIHLGGNLAQQKLFSFQNVSFSQQTKGMKKGIGYVPDDEEESIGVEVVIPLAKR